MFTAHHRFGLASTLALLVAASTFAQSPGPGHKTPISRNPLVEALMQIQQATASADLTQQYENALAMAYLQVPANFDPAIIDAANAQLWANAFGETYALDTSGVWSVGASGEFDVTNYTTVYSAQGGAEEVQELTLWRVDPTQHGILLTVPLGMTAECFVHSARFGQSDPHIGYATRIDDGTNSLLLYSPLASVPDGGLISSDQAASFIAFVGTDAFTSMTFLEWAGNGIQGSIGGGDGSAGDFELSQYSRVSWCDVDGTRACLMDAVAQFGVDIHEASTAHTDRVNEIMEEFADGSTANLGGYIAGGAAAGGLGGALTSGPMGAAVGALGGAIAGGIGWLVHTSYTAGDAQEDLDEAHAEYAAARCTAMTTAASSMKDCYAEHCPELYEAASAQIDATVAASGC
jgi:hypothetical protein